jgi:hypothetical protein
MLKRETQDSSVGIRLIHELTGEHDGEREADLESKEGQRVGERVVVGDARNETE